MRFWKAPEFRGLTLLLPHFKQTHKLKQGYNFGPNFFSQLTWTEVLSSSIWEQFKGEVITNAKEDMKDTHQTSYTERALVFENLGTHFIITS